MYTERHPRLSPTLYGVVGPPLQGTHFSTVVDGCNIAYYRQNVHGGRFQISQARKRPPEKVEVTGRLVRPTTYSSHDYFINLACCCLSCARACLQREAMSSPPFDRSQHYVLCNNNIFPTGQLVRRFDSPVDPLARLPAPTVFLVVSRTFPLFVASRIVSAKQSK